MSHRTYLREFGLCMLGYVVLLALSVWLLASGLAASGTARTVVALLPMVPAAGIVFVVLRQLRRMDELQRRLQVEALALAFAGTAILTFSYGFLELVGFPRLPMFSVWPVMASLWLLGTFLGQRRYR